MFYITSTPWWLKSIFPKGLVWEGDPANRTIYLTFDDGPHPEITPFVLELLDKAGMKGTFFCIGENVERYPETFQLITEKGHRVGNHTHTHPDGWKMNTEEYIMEIKKAATFISSDLFRPPYGKITNKQVIAIKKELPGTKIIMWTGVTGDFDTQKTGGWCAKKAIQMAHPGSLIVFHDSEKAFPRLKIALPALLAHLQKNGFTAGLL
jgi:peptidoglycan-N-acetylglucosamine deacetylase